MTEISTGFYWFHLCPQFAPLLSHLRSFRLVQRSVRFKSSCFLLNLLFFTFTVYRIIIVNFDSQLRAVTQQRVRETIFLTFLFPLVSRCIGGGACSACTDP